jgi:3'-phosphoadenosine 5'-phosphosulfate sulfotransferase (PAPS reductase)/FAD synthetase
VDKKLRLEWRDPKSLKPNEKNWRTHPEKQKKLLSAVMSEVGWAGSLLYNEQTGNLIDGHARREEAIAKGEKEVPVLIGSWSLEEEHKILATLDPIAAMAEQADAIYSELLKGIHSDNEDLQKWCDELIVSIDKAAGKGSGADSDRPAILKTATLEELAPTSVELEVLAGKRFLVEFSGGKDSTAATVWLKCHFPESPVELMFVDMGADFIGMNLFLFRFASFVGYPLRLLRTPVTMFDLMLDKGKWPMFIGPYCHDLLHKALDDYTMRYKADDVVVVRGGRLAEKAKSGVTRKTRFMEVDRLKGYPFFQPLYFSAKGVSVSVLEEAGAPIWEGYSRGLQRTACRICPGQKPSGYAAIRANFPDVWEELLYLEKRFGAGCWQARTEAGSQTLNELADKGQEAFVEGQYKSWS